MKHILCLSLFCLIATFSFSETSSECPRNKTDCRGECGRMIDENNDNFCDYGNLSQPKKNKSPYCLFEIIGGVMLLYLLSQLFVKRRIYSKITHRKIWNYLLLVTFLISGLLGLLLVVLINFDIDTTYYRHYLVWHVDVGIAMSVVAIVHFLWHWNYYFPQNKKHKTL
ncbi:MAG: hypothetical protein EOM76_07430 [Sphingobacteriia bacterium]|jgi:hypothetical protein|nr:hypothetical protein [Sphingobacteriia bacterium]